EEELGPAQLGPDLAQESLDAILRPHGLARDHVLTRDESFGVAAEIHEDAVAIDAFDEAAHQLARAMLVLADDARALGLAHLLHDDLLRSLGGDATKANGLHRLLDEAAGR